MAVRRSQTRYAEPQTSEKTATSRPPAPEADVRGDAARLPDDVWVVVPAFNEEDRIGAVLDGLLSMTRKIVVVDDGSSDRTPDEVLRRPVWLVSHLVNLGQGAALQTGIKYALARGAERVVTFDGDGQHDPRDIRALLHALDAEDADFALGSRFLGAAENIPAARRVVLWFAILFTRLFSGVALTDTHNGLRAMTRRGSRRISISMNRMEHASEIIDQIATSGLKFVEVPVRISYTRSNLAKGQKNTDAFRLGFKLILDRLSR